MSARANFRKKKSKIQLENAKKTNEVIDSQALSFMMNCRQSVVFSPQSFPDCRKSSRPTVDHCRGWESRIFFIYYYLLCGFIKWHYAKQWGAPGRRNNARICKCLYENILIYYVGAVVSTVKLPLQIRTRDYDPGIKFSIRVLLFF